jgi:DNA-binding transcriptional ArsR family regulator
MYHDPELGCRLMPHTNSWKWRKKQKFLQYAKLAEKDAERFAAFLAVAADPLWSTTVSSMVNAIVQSEGGEERPGEATGVDVAAWLDLHPNTVDYYAEPMVAMGLLELRMDGPYPVYRVVPEILAEVPGWLDEVGDFFFDLAGGEKKLKPKREYRPRKHYPRGY